MNRVRALSLLAVAVFLTVLGGLFGTTAASATSGYPPAPPCAATNSVQSANCGVAATATSKVPGTTPSSHGTSSSPVYGTSSNNSGGLSYTGVAVVGLGVIGLALVVGGSVLVFGGRRRNAHG